MVFVKTFLLHELNHIESNNQMTKTNCGFHRNLDKVTKKTNDGIYRSDSYARDGACQVLHKEHARTLYSIHSPGASILTTGQDRCIASFHWDRSDGHILNSFLLAFHEQ